MSDRETKVTMILGVTTETRERKKTLQISKFKSLAESKTKMSKALYSNHIVDT